VIEYVNGTLTITDDVVVTAKSYTREYGDTNPTFEYTVDGAKLEGTPAITCEATATSPVGTYDIIIAKGDITNTDVTYVNGKLTITKAPLTITAKSYTVKQGKDLPALKLEYSGFKNNETDTVFTTKPTVTTKATKNSAPGTYEITVSGAEANNYEIKYENGTLTIKEKAESFDGIVLTVDKGGDMDDAFEVQNEVKSVLSDYLDPVRSGGSDGWDIGTLPKETQILMQLGVMRSKAVIQRITMIGHYIDADGEHELDTKDIEITPFMVPRNGEHKVIITNK
jgi:hypothetical protein